MKKNNIIFLLVLLLSVAACSFTTKKIDPKDNSKEAVLAELVTFVLENYHFSPVEIDDEFSENVYREYLKVLDPRRRFFIQSDLDEFVEFETQLDDQLRARKVDFFELTYSRLQQRMGEMENIYADILDQPFDFSKEEEINTDYEKLGYPSDENARRDTWRKQLKLSALASFHDLKKKDLEKRENPDDEDADEPYEPKTDEELEKEARKKALNSLDQFFNLNKDLTKENWFSVYLNAVANEFDPHTGYYAPPDKDKFDIAMSGSLEGIGAQLQKDMDEIKIVSLISGGPAWTDGRLKVGDKITEVRQEDEEKPVSIVGMSINDAVKLIRGPKGSKVFLTVRSVDGTTKIIDLVRDVVELEETYAKSAITEKEGRKYGLIKLPSFYFYMEDYNKRNAASDMKHEIQALKKEGISGLVVDLRNNGGGSLTTAIEIAGLFVKKGPVVQVLSGDNKKKVLRDQSAAVEWDGPLVILVNELSASASEILAAAMQDYERAVIIGSKQTYGKGTVQRFLDLNSFVRNAKLGDMGSVKITTQKFYRINGGATQLKGVESDVVIPDGYSYMDVGERDLEAPLPWDEIDAAVYQKWNGYTNLSEAIEHSRNRVDTSGLFNLVDENARWIKNQRDEYVYSLKYDTYKLKVEKDEEMAEHFKSISEYKTNLEFSALPEEVLRFENDTTLEKQRIRWHKNLSKDAYIEEAFFVLEDLKLSDVQQRKMAKVNDND